MTSRKQPKPRKPAASRRQPGLSPDLERGNPKLDGLAEQWDDLNAQTKAAKEKVDAEMRRLKKEHYKHGKIKITMTKTESIRISVDKEPPVED